MTADQGQLNRALAAIKREYGDDTVRMGIDQHSPERIPTGALELDIVLRGGVPIGRWSHFYGGQFSAKSLLALKVIGNAQRMGQSVAFYDAEKQFEPKWARKQGVDVDNLLIIENTKIEEIGATMETLMPVIDLHVIDSIAAAVSIDEIAANTEDWRPGISARAWGKAARRAHAAMDGSRNTVIMINHVGTVFGKYAGGDEPKGGKFLEYLSSLSAEFRRTSWLYKDKSGSFKTEGKGDDTLSGDKEPAGIEFAVRVKKSRVSTPFKTARLRLDFATGEFDDLWSIAKAAELYDLVEKSSPTSSWFNLPDGSKVQGTGQLREYLQENDDFKKQVVDAMWEHVSE
jgi:recombination protein RecA